MRFRDYRAGLNNPGTYLLPGDTRPTSLVIGGRADFPGSRPGGSLTTLDNSYAKIGDLANADVLPNGGVTFVVPDGGNTNTRPAVIVNTAQPAASVGGPSGFDFAALFARYRTISADMYACPSTIGLYDQNGREPWNGTDPTATIGLAPGQNVLTLTGQQLATLKNINRRTPAGRATSPPATCSGTSPPRAPSPCRPRHPPCGAPSTHPTRSSSTSAPPTSRAPS